MFLNRSSNSQAVQTFYRSVVLRAVEIPDLLHAWYGVCVLETFTSPDKKRNTPVEKRNIWPIIIKANDGREKRRVCKSLRYFGKAAIHSCKWFLNIQNRSQFKNDVHNSCEANFLSHVIFLNWSSYSQAVQFRIFQPWKDVKVDVCSIWQDPQYILLFSLSFI